MLHDLRNNEQRPPLFLAQAPRSETLWSQHRGRAVHEHERVLVISECNEVHSQV